MAELPDPVAGLTAEDRALYERMASERAHADGRPELGEVYVRMFNNPGVVAVVNGLGEHLRFHGLLPDRVRELAILRFAQQRSLGYEWSHHVRPAGQAGVEPAVVAEIGAGRVPAELSELDRAVIDAVDAVAAQQSIPEPVQQRIADALGEAGVVEIVALCGLYALMGYMVTAFDIATEEGFPPAPFEPGAVPGDGSGQAGARP